MSHHRRRFASTLSAAAIVACAVAMPDVASGAGRLKWTPCHADVGPRFECAVAQVPLDYDRPRGPSDLARVDPAPRHRPEAPGRLAVPQPGRAGRVGRRLRPLRRARAVHPGGAGPLRPRGVRPARHHAKHAAALLRQPRGMASVPAGACSRSRTTQEQQRSPSIARSTAPARDRSGPIRDHMSTANVARDMDVLRDLVGDDKLTYAGVSYGSYLGVDLREPVPRSRAGARG